MFKHDQSVLCILRSNLFVFSPKDTEEMRDKSNSYVCLVFTRATLVECMYIRATKKNGLPKRFLNLF